MRRSSLAQALSAVLVIAAPACHRGATEPRTDAAAALGALPPSETEPSHKQYVVEKPSPDALDITVEYFSDTGTSHCAERVLIRDGAGTSLIVSTPNDAFEKGTPLAPLVERQIRIGASAFLLLGWSSTGAGMQTNHALVVAKTREGAFAIVDHLELTTDRWSAGLALDTRGPVRVGVPEIVEDASLHNPDDWRLRSGEKLIGLAAIRRLDFRPAEVRSEDVYAPPFRRRNWPLRGRFAWFEMTSTGAREGRR